MMTKKCVKLGDFVGPVGPWEIHESVLGYLTWVDSCAIY